MHKLRVKPLATAAFLLILPLAVIVVRQSLSDAAVLTYANTPKSGSGPIVAPLIASSDGEVTGGDATIEQTGESLAGRSDANTEFRPGSRRDDLSAFTVSADESADLTDVDTKWADDAGNEAADAASIAERLYEGELAVASPGEADVAGETAESIASRAAENTGALDDDHALVASDAAFVGDASLAASLLPASDRGSTAPSTPGSPDTQRSPRGRGEERVGGGGSGGSGDGADGTERTPSSPPEAYLSGSRPPAGGGGESNGRPSSLPPGGVLSVPDSLPPSSGGPETGRLQSGTRVIESGAPYGDVRGSISPVPSAAQTPELGSLALFGTGAAGMAGYALTRLRASRRRGPPSD